MISALAIIGSFALKLGTGLVHFHLTPIEHRSIQRSDCGLGFRRPRHFDKSHAAGLARVPVHDDRDGFDGSHLSQLLLGCRDIKVPDKNVDHNCIPARAPRTRPKLKKRF